ncbi:hypothetical protein GCM10012275_37780 [Longimycelium tulufanense]|uniref:Single-stranded DNA-binding protein n=1 Tax=Longimycelium tulufanense TaxID=907463 RepID=A0A8J3FXL0_9PSEU|nr:single-stranded DNA-binding protein [Longimycelium tulufanense]GGM63645.1 hypothetical protein GCM10012275_37780 [Longimycelium tulufanense]
MNEVTVTVMGYVNSTPTERRTSEGKKVVSFWLGNTERRFDRNSGKWENGDRLSVRVSCWRRLADGVATSLAKGDPVLVTGRLYSRNYQVEGQWRSATELDAHAVGLDLGRYDALPKGGPPAARHEDPPGSADPTTTPEEADPAKEVGTQRKLALVAT